jgi:hypothetical protein
MSLPTPPPPTEPEPYKPPDFGSALLILVGLVLLLPGLCAIFSAITMVPAMWNSPSAIVPLGLLWAFCILISYGGLRLIARSSRGSRG